MPADLAPATASPHPRPSSTAGDERGADSGHGTIPSANLLSGRASVTIDHEGTLYVLRATRAGKLILTK